MKSFFNLFKTPSVLAMLALMSALGTACNTLEGVGEDVEQAGDEIEDATDN